MRPMLGISVDDGEVGAVLVDADVPSLGPFDSRRRPTEPGSTPADTAAAAATEMTERAANASLSIHAIGLVAGAADAEATQQIAAAVRAATDVVVEVVELDDARLAYLAGAPELAETPVLALHTRTDGRESASVVDIRSRAVLASVTPAGDVFSGHGESLPESMDEAVARAGVSPNALVFLDLRPGDAAPARELSTILGVPFLTPHGVPWHRATGASLVAAVRTAPVAPVPALTSGRGRGVVLLAVLIALVAILGAGLAVAVGGIAQTGTSRPVDTTPGLHTSVSPPVTPVPQPDRATAPDPCAEVRPVSWPLRASDPDVPAPGGVTSDTPVPAESAPCGPVPILEP